MQAKRGVVDVMTAHVDTFVRDRLPPRGQWPEFRFDLPELNYPEMLNAAVELIGSSISGTAPAHSPSQPPQHTLSGGWEGERAGTATEKNRDAPAIVNDAGRWSYGEIADRSDRIARLLAEEEGLVPGNRVLLRGPNGAMLFASWLGVLKAGGVLVTTMPMLRGGEVATLLERARVSHAIVDSRTKADFEAGAAAAGTVRSLLTYDGDGGGGALEQRLAKVAPGFTPVPTRADDVAMIAFTSGTTGSPKGCVHFHRDILASADSFARHVLQPRRGDRWACSAPIGFTFGLGMLLTFPWRFGGCAVTIETPGPKPLLEAIERHQVTVLATAPTAYKAMLGLLCPLPREQHRPTPPPNLPTGYAMGGWVGERAGTANTNAEHDISSLRTCVSAGEHLPAATWAAWHEATGIRLIDGIGATELMHIFISAAGDDIRPGATGKAVPGYEATVLDEHNRPMASGTGRLAVKGPTGCRYFDDQRQRDYVVDGWNVTGDTYRKDEEGYFWYLARSDDMIVSAGYNIAAPEVENALLSHPAVQECAVIGVACEERGQRVKAFVVAAAGHGAGDDLAEALQAHVKAAIAPYKYPREIEFVDALPKTVTGKLQRYALRQQES
ncbi:MAG: AMP-binding protein [Sphingosinicella sp.]